MPPHLVGAMSNPTPTHISGLFVAGDSLFHRLDPRSKLLALPLYVTCSFVLHEFAALAGLVVVFAVLLHCSSIPVLRYLRFLFTLRYLFMFTLLVYLFFTPGHTLFGVTWLSRDGFELGLVVCLQLCLALGFSMLVSSTTPPADLAVGIERLLTPLGHLGAPVNLISESLQLVMHFVDSLFATVTAVKPKNLSGTSFRQRLEGGVATVGMLLESSLDQADNFALKLSRGEPLGLVTKEGRHYCFGWREWVFVLGTTAVLALLSGAL